MIYNVLVPVVELVEADSGDEAIEKLKKHLRSLGVETYSGGEADAFESEPGAGEPVIR